MSGRHQALTNAGGAVSDIWNARERGLASAIYATVPFLGPGKSATRSLLSRAELHLRTERPSACSVIGPIVGGFVAQNPRLGWHFNFWLMFIFSGFTLVTGYFITPETVRCVSPFGCCLILVTGVI